MTTKGTRNQNREQPSVAALSLCLVHQLLADVRRPEISIMPTTDGNYAIVVRSMACENGDRGDALAIVPYESWVEVGGVMNDSSADGYADVVVFSETRLDGDAVLADLLLAVADAGWSERGFGDTIAAIEKLRTPGFRQCVGYIKRRHPGVLLEELKQRLSR